MGRHAAVLAVSLCVVCLDAGTAAAQYFGRNKVHYDRLEFRLLQTDHFDVHYYAEAEAAARIAARLAERWYARLSRVLGHTFADRQPIVLYASHPHFAQTNLMPGAPGEGVGGFTERGKSRIAMPFAAGLGETDHVLGHEIAHAFQIAIARHERQDAFRLPGWFIEGMAEYLSIGPADPHTMMWVRDAALHERLPTLKQLEDPRYFPYRYGHALWSYLASRFGDGVAAQVLRAPARGGVVGRLERVTGLDAETLTGDWHMSIQVALQQAVEAVDATEVPGRPLAVESDARVHVAPAISPDGRRVMFISERDRLSLDLFMADTSSGEVIRKIIGTAADPHFDSLQYIHSSGAWDRSGRRFAMTALRAGDPVLVILDIESGRREEIALADVREIYNPSWSPDGARIVFSGLKGGLSDLFIHTLATGITTPVTADAFADLHPAWSADGRTIAFATDRFTTTLDALAFGPLRIGLLDVETGGIRALAGDQPRAKQVSPQWAPDGRSVYFVSDAGGVSNVTVVDVASGTRRTVTRVAGGISGITATSPALAVAAESGVLAFSVFRNGRHEIRTMADDAVAGPSVSASRADGPGAVGSPAGPARSPVDSTIRPADAGGDQAASVAGLLADPRYGLPAPTNLVSREYDDRLRLESISQPYVGAATGNTFGGVLRASFGITFGDLLRDRELQAVVRVGTDRDDFAAQMAYMNRQGQWNWGLSAGFLPSRFSGARRSIEREPDVVTRETTHLRYEHQWLRVMTRYNMHRSRRLELSAGVRRTGFEWQTVTRVTDSASRELVSRVLSEQPAGRPVYQAELQAAFVHDTAVFGPTGPVLGQRLRVELEPVLGRLPFADVRVDARRYFMPVRPFTIAARVEHVGRYGAGARDPRLTPLVFGLQTLVRGYDLRTFAADECGRSATACSIMDELTGSRFAVANLELRAPLKGLFTGELEYGRTLPIEAIAFVDAGFLWTRGAGGARELDRFRSVGAGARANVGGFVVEVTAARPFDRLGAGWTASVLLRPGW
jgi:hypothetical protein